MPRVLLTGSSGGVGRAARPALEAAGWTVQPFDLADGQDLRDPQAVADAMRGCDAVVHAGALAHDSAGSPAYLPVDDDHPLRAARPYGMSKRLAEEMCQAWTTRTGIPTVVFRPVMILDDQGFARYSPETAEFGAVVHVDDVAAATVRALTADLEGHRRLTLCGPGSFDCTRATATLGWTATRTREGHQPPERGA